jgi:heme-degrading monooxygenase HmoA
MIISITRLRVWSHRFLPGFIYYALRSSRQASSAPGNLGKGLLREANNTYWTRTAWQDEAAMRAFMMAMPHRSAMGKLAEWCDEASVVHWTQESAELPAWDEAHRRMVAEGRASRVRHPSAAHQAFQIPAPKY